jgi:hypothetical protein
MTRKTLALAICFPALAFFFEGRFGLIAASAAFIAWWGFALPRPVLWGSAVLLLATAPIVLMAQGLPSSKVVGAGFGVEHLLAHRLVVLSLVVAALAAFSELLDLDAGSRRHRSLLRQLGPDGVPVSTVPAQLADGDKLGPDHGSH